MQNDPIQGILFDQKHTIKFRDPFTRSEKLVNSIKQLTTLPYRAYLKSRRNVKPTFSTDLMPAHTTTASTADSKSITISTHN